MSGDISLTITSRILFLSKASQNILSLAYFCKKKQNVVFTKKGAENLCRALAKSYPQENCKAMTSKEMVMYQKELVTEFFDLTLTVGYMSQFYENLTEFMELLGKETKFFTSKNSCDLIIMILEAISNFVCAFLIFLRIEEKRNMFAAYSSAYRSLNGSISPHDRFYKFLWNITSLDILQKEMEPMSSKIEVMIQSLFPEMELKMVDPTQMRLGNFYNIKANQHDLAIPSLYLFPRIQCISLLTMQRLVFFTLMLFPSSMTRNGELVATTVSIVSDNYVLCLYGDEAVYTVKEMCLALEHTKDARAVIKTLESTMIQPLSIIMAHKKKREFLSSVFGETIGLLKDQPGLLGPKLVQILALYAAAHSELEYYSIHTVQELNRLTKKSQEFSVDGEIVILIYYFSQLKVLLEKYMFVVKRYFLGFFKDYDLAALEHTLEIAKDAKIKHHISEMIKFIRTCTVATDPTERSECSYMTYISWLSAQTYMVCCSVPDPIESIMHHITSLHNASFHALVQCDDFRFFKSTLNFNSVILNSRFFEVLFKEVILHPYLCQYSIAVPEFMSHYDFDFHYADGSAQLLYDTLLLMISDNLTSVARRYFRAFTFILDSFGKQALKQDSSQAVYNFVVQTHKFVESTKKTESITPFNAVKETEELLVQSLSDKGIAAIFSIINEMSIMYCNIGTIKLGHLEFRTPMYLAQPLEEFLAEKLYNVCIPGVEVFDSVLGIRRPCIVLNQLKSLYKGILILGNCVKADFAYIFASHMLYHSQNTTDDEDKLTITARYINLYVGTLLSRNFINEGLVYGPLRKCFIVRITSPNKFDEYTGVLEMRALATIVGPYGITTICNRIHNYIVGEVAFLRSYLVKASLNVSLTDTNNQFYTVVEETVKKWKTHQEFIETIKNIGNAFRLRTLLLEGLRDAHVGNNRFMQEALTIYKPSGPLPINVSYLLEASGIESDMPEDILILMKQAGVMIDSEMQFWTHTYLSFLIMAIIQLSTTDLAQYTPILAGHPDNAHTLLHGAVKIMKLVSCFYPSKRIEEFHDVIKGFQLNLGFSVMKVYCSNSATNKVGKDALMALYDNLMNELIRSSFVPLEADLVPYQLISHSFTNIFLQRKQMRKKA